MTKKNKIILISAGVVIPVAILSITLPIVLKTKNNDTNFFNKLIMKFTNLKDKEVIVSSDADLDLKIKKDQKIILDTIGDKYKIIDGERKYLKIRNSETSGDDKITTTFKGFVLFINGEKQIPFKLKRETTQKTSNLNKAKLQNFIQKNTNQIATITNYKEYDLSKQSERNTLLGFIKNSATLNLTPEEKNSLISIETKQGNITNNITNVNIKVKYGNQENNLNLKVKVNDLESKVANNISIKGIETLVLKKPMHVLLPIDTKGSLIIGDNKIAIENEIKKFIGINDKLNGVVITASIKKDVIIGYFQEEKINIELSKDNGDVIKIIDWIWVKRRYTAQETFNHIDEYVKKHNKSRIRLDKNSTGKIIGDPKNKKIIETKIFQVLPMYLKNENTIIVNISMKVDANISTNQQTINATFTINGSKIKYTRTFIVHAY